MTLTFPCNPTNSLRARGAAVAAALALSSLAQAAEPSHPFVLTAYSDAPGGAAILSGNYTEAVAAARRPSVDLISDLPAVQTNLCIAYTQLRQWDSARSACNAAVSAAREADMPIFSTAAFTGRNNYIAVALSNRAVLHWLASDAAAAATDLKKAGMLAPNADFVSRNLDALQASHDAVAQVTVAPTT
jgi:hypothetical protein